MKIPLIIPNYNQLTYLRNLINWWKWYHPDYPVFIVDNGSDYPPLLEYYESLSDALVFINRNTENDFIGNLTRFISSNKEYEYYVVSDPDIMPHPNTPPNFLEIWKRYLDNGYHRIGFNLITEDLPDWLHDKNMIQHNEKELLIEEVVNEHGFPGYRAPIDTTFAMYTTKNKGWHAPVDGNLWTNCIRLFNAFHLGWYVNGDYLNEEMRHYFQTANYKDHTKPSAGRNNNRPKEFIHE